MLIPKEEIEADLAATERDINSLERICDGLRVFIEQSHGENRSAFRMDLFKYTALGTQARTLKQRIQTYLTEATTPSSPL